MATNPPNEASNSGEGDLPVPSKFSKNSGLPRQFVDTDPTETGEWLDSLQSVIDNQGKERARYLMRELLRSAHHQDVGIPAVRQTDYINTISPEDEPEFPGDEYLERRIRSYIRWNAVMMVHRAQRPGVGVGGHISSYASSAALYEVGMNHFFRGPDAPGGADQIFWQGHASPGAYSRAFLEGRLSEEQLAGFRQELSAAPNGLPSYPHPRLMPDFWQFPTVSMGLGPQNAIHQARFNRYLHDRGIKDTSEQHVWAFLGDGEMDEPEATGPLWQAARDGLDNLTFVINCNLQRLDGPVRGNGKIIQDLESVFRGAGWNVIKVVWGRGWDPLLEADNDGALINLMNQTLDGDYQTFKGESGGFIREHFFGRDPRTLQLVADMSDDDIWRLQRGGHDYTKLYAAYRAALEHTGRPTVILAKTIKGWTLGHAFESRNATHQMKSLTADDLKLFRDRLYLDIPDSELDPVTPPFIKPDEKSDELEYLRERRAALGGSLPKRTVVTKSFDLPGEDAYQVIRGGSGNQPVATTMAFVRLVKELIKDKQIGPRWVPIIPDEARTFGMDAMFPTQKIYNPAGQQYLSVDRELFLSYKESETGQILHEGINEAGAAASFIAAGTSYATHGEPMIPIYIFYSMFGFQRTGDHFWAAMDQMARGFLLGATAGRTTLNGEGLQHQDGHSPLLASTNPGVVAYDPAFSYELAHIVRDGLERMYGENPEDIYYYLTVYNEPYPQPAEPEGVDVEGILKGMHRVAEALEVADAVNSEPVRLLASGVGVTWALKAQELLATNHKVAAEVWSVTSWGELRRDGLATDREALLNPGTAKCEAYVTKALGDSDAPVVAVSDFMRSVQDQIQPWVKAPWTSLGTDGWGMSDTRDALRRYFLVDAESITVAALGELVKLGTITDDAVSQAISQYNLDFSGGIGDVPREPFN